MQVYPFGGPNHVDSMHSDPSETEDAQSSLNYSLKQGYGSCICYQFFLVFTHPCSWSISTILFIIQALVIIFTCVAFIYLFIYQCYFFVLGKTGFILHLHLVHLLILKLLHFKQLKITLKMEEVLWVWHHIFPGNKCPILDWYSSCKDILIGLALFCFS